MAKIKDEDSVGTGNSIWAGLLETVGTVDIDEYVEQWDKRSDEVVNPLKEAEQLAAQDFQIRINAR
jgi:hypothetical protein